MHSSIYFNILPLYSQVIYQEKASDVETLSNKSPQISVSQILSETQNSQFSEPNQCEALSHNRRHRANETE